LYLHDGFQLAAQFLTRTTQASFHRALGQTQLLCNLGHPPILEVKVLEQLRLISRQTRERVTDNGVRAKELAARPSSRAANASPAESESSDAGRLRR
jgi:hypothetical protein